MIPCTNKFGEMIGPLALSIRESKHLELGGRIRSLESAAKPTDSRRREMQTSPTSGTTCQTKQSNKTFFKTKLEGTGNWKMNSTSRPKTSHWLACYSNELYADRLQINVPQILQCERKKEPGSLWTNVPDNHDNL